MFLLTLRPKNALLKLISRIIHISSPVVSNIESMEVLLYWREVQPRVCGEGQGPSEIRTQSLALRHWLEALSREFCYGVPWEDLYVDDLVIITDSLEECVSRLLI